MITTNLTKSLTTSLTTSLTGEMPVVGNLKFLLEDGSGYILLEDNFYLLQE